MFLVDHLLAHVYLYILLKANKFKLAIFDEHYLFTCNIGIGVVYSFGNK